MLKRVETLQTIVTVNSVQPKTKIWLKVELEWNAVSQNKVVLFVPKVQTEAPANYLIFTLQILFTGKPLYEMLFSVSTYVEYLLPPLICIYSCLHFCLYLLDVVVNYLIFVLQILFKGKPLYEMLFSVSTCRL